MILICNIIRLLLIIVCIIISNINGEDFIMRLKYLNRIVSYIAVSALFSATAVNAAPSSEEMWQTIQEQQKVIEQLQEQIDATAEAVETGDGGGASWADQTYIGGYGELHYRGGDGTDNVDFHRFVLYFGHDFNDRVHYFSEVELEHALAGEGQPGEVELEQAWIEIDLTENHRFRAGLDILPIGLINVNHEPNTFYGVERPEVEKRIIPATWWEAGLGFNGEMAPGVNYDIVLHSGMETTTNIRSGRQKVADANAEHPAGTARIRYTGVPGLELAASLHHQSNIEATTTDAGSNEATLFTTHIDYRHNSGLGLRALYAGWDMERDLSTDGKDSDGWYVEPSYRWAAGMGELGVYARYEEIDRSLTASKNEQERYSTGFNYWPTDQVAFKFTYESVKDVDADTNVDNFYFGIGYQF